MMMPIMMMTAVGPDQSSEALELWSVGDCHDANP